MCTQTGPLWGGCCLTGHNPGSPSAGRPEGCLCHFKSVHIDRCTELNGDETATVASFAQRAGPLWRWCCTWHNFPQSVYHHGSLSCLWARKRGSNTNDKMKQYCDSLMQNWRRLLRWNGLQWREWWCHQSTMAPQISRQFAALTKHLYMHARKSHLCFSPIS